MADYFTPETDASIKRYLESDERSEKHRIFDAEIKPAFETLIENLIHVYRFHRIDDVDTLKRDCLTNLYEMLPKYDPNRGKKGFSYFNVVARNWFIHRLREKKKQGLTASDLQYDLDHEVVKNDPCFSLNPFEDQIVEKEFWVALFDDMDKWRDLLKKKSERQVLDAVVFMIRNPHLITIYNRKAIYLYLRDMTGLNTKQVVVNLKKIKELYVRFKEEFDSSGEAAVCCD